MKNTKKLLGIIALAIIALTMTTCEDVIETLARLKNGTYTLSPRPQGRAGNGSWASIYVSKVEVDNGYITIFFENHATENNGYGGSSTIYWTEGTATLFDYNDESISKKNTYHHAHNNSNIVYIIFNRIDSKRLKLTSNHTNTNERITFSSILLGSPDS
ncbi:MAG: hypothetical protein FWD36_06670 [Treponema sp.]|nr:hypothetical protein [Treponema sp.]